MKPVSIYKATNTSNDKIYIGQTVQPIRQRWNSHVRAALKDDKDLHFYRAIRLYGRDSFRVEEIAQAENKEWADYLERLYILIYDALNPEVGYNMTYGGHGVPHTLENKTKIGAASRAWWRVPENKKRASESRKGLLVGERNPMYGRHDLGKPHTEETKRKLSETRTELFKDPEFKKRMSEANTGKHHTPEGRANISKGSTGNHKLGTTQTDATKLKISETMKLRWQEKRDAQTKEAA